MTWRFRSRNSKYQTTSDWGGGRCKQEMMESFREGAGLCLRVGTKAPLTSANKIGFFFFSVLLLPRKNTNCYVVKALCEGAPGSRVISAAALLIAGCDYVSG